MVLGFAEASFGFVIDELSRIIWRCEKRKALSLLVCDSTRVKCRHKGLIRTVVPLLFTDNLTQPGTDKGGIVLFIIRLEVFQYSSLDFRLLKFLPVQQAVGKGVPQIGVFGVGV